MQKVKENLGGIAQAGAENRKSKAGGGAKSLPPPGEMTQMHLEEKELKARNARAARRLASKKGSSHASTGYLARKPMTTLQKIRAAEASGNGLPKKGVARKDRERVGGLMKQLERQSATAGYPVCESGEVKYVGFTSRFVSKKADRVRKEKGACERGRGQVVDLTKAVVAGGKGKKKAEQAKPFRFLDLPDEVRARIYRHAVVEEKLCIWPTSPTGREQPDISMVNRQVRNEVLPIFYGENTFAISISPMKKAPKVKKILNCATKGVNAKEPMSGLMAVKEWALTLDNNNTHCFAMIRKWAFEYIDPDVGFMPEAGEESKSCVLSIRPPEDVYTEEGIEVSPLVEVHREAACFMPGWGECGKCVCQRTPLRVNAAVIAWQAAGEFKAMELINLAKQLQDLVEELAEACCERASF